ncbi:hypothetical protein [Streptomyces buecherae]|uniref:hypothetical protein n=1 Tax=Streptomyces buecherae TaxID=2763006 RepID=UPI0037A41C27
MPDAPGLTLAALRAELASLTALAGSAERPKPNRINPAGHAMPGHEWTITEQDRPHTTRTFTWTIRTVDDAETCDAVYVSSPHSATPAEDFVPVLPADARRIAMALLAAADRAEHLTAGVPRLEDRRPA